MAKGQPSCRKARRIARGYLRQSDQCGQANAGEPPCEVGAWTCWLASAGDQIEENMLAFCHLPKEGGVTSSFWEPRNYRKAIKIGKVRGSGRAS